MNTLKEEIRLPAGIDLQLVQGDLTAERTDAIVNAANAALQHAGGLARAIARGGGAVIQAESDAWVQEHGPVSHAEPAWTSGGNLPAKTVIHAVGPVWGEGDEDAKLAAAVTGALRTADQLGLASIALPAISTGIFGFPKERAAGITLSAIQEYFRGRGDPGIKLIRLVLYDQATLNSFLTAWHDHFKPESQA